VLPPISARLACGPRRHQDGEQRLLLTAANMSSSHPHRSPKSNRLTPAGIPPATTPRVSPCDDSHSTTRDSLFRRHPCSDSGPEQRRSTYQNQESTRSPLSLKPAPNQPAIWAHGTWTEQHKRRAGRRVSTLLHAGRRHDLTHANSEAPERARPCETAECTIRIPSHEVMRLHRRALVRPMSRSRLSASPSTR
jgi:hypothetical protein